MRSHPGLIAMFVFTAFIYFVGFASGEELDYLECQKDSSPSTCRHRESEESDKNKDCRLVFAPVSDNADQWGVFSLDPRSKGTPVWNYGDVVIQWASGILNNTGMEGYLWNGQETGGQFEGKTGKDKVYSIVPGLGMLTQISSSGTSTANLIPFAPRFDEGGITRFESPGAGSITHYHNYTWYFQKNVDPGDQLIMAPSLRLGPQNSADSQRASLTEVKPTLRELRQKGYCLDNLRPKKSRVKEAGRGAFATRSLREGSIVAPVPVLALRRSNIDQRELLINYCFGHKNSNILFFPYGPMINLINHYTQPNVKLQWASSSQKYLEQPAEILTSNNQTLLLELVATKPIQEGEELYLDYGREWEDAWWTHVQSWTPYTEMQYTPSYVMDDAIGLLRTAKEQKDYPYPENLFTSCFYRYSDLDQQEKMLEQSSDSNTVTSFHWKFTKGLFDLKHLRPCQVLKRNEDTKKRLTYSVRVFNRPGLEETELIPEKAMHIITNVPRYAIRFSDKAGTTDQHLPNAFRHPIGMSDTFFQNAWLDQIKNENQIRDE